jgi:hypothetical protein
MPHQVRHDMPTKSKEVLDALHYEEIRERLSGKPKPHRLKTDGLFHEPISRSSLRFL